MSLGATYFRHLTCCLTILLAPMGNLQQVHAFCQWTGCSCDCHGDDACASRGHAEGCAHEECDFAALSAVSTQCCCGHFLQRQDLPCQQNCGCCQPADPLLIPGNGTEGAKQLLASGVQSAVNGSTCALPSDSMSSLSDADGSLADTLSAAHFCAQLCRFQI